MGRFYVTTPIYYVNDLPHVGHIYTTVVADTLARYHRLAGDEVFFLTGTDEHGQKIERAAQERGLAPRELADQVVPRFQDLWRRLGSSHDDFLRTTEARHRQAVEAIVGRLEAAGDLYTARHEGWYCTSCETFYTEKELQEGRRCPDHDLPAEWRSEENVFFRLSRYQRPLLELYERHPEFVRPETRANEVRAFVGAGLRDLSVSRANLAWGIPFPGRPGQTVYVWLDALTNYVSALGYGAGAPGAGRYGRFWEEAGQRIHLVGKDILRFHAVYWPAFLLSAGLPLPSTVWAHGWWLMDGRKISKSAGKVPRPDHLLADFGPDPLRFYLLRAMHFGQDAAFSDQAFIDTFNADLANGLGNSLSRLVTLSRRAFAGRTPPLSCDDNPLRAVAQEVVGRYRHAMEELAFQRALEEVWRLLGETDRYLVAREPWRLLKREGPTEGLSRVLSNGLEAVRLAATALLPVMPQVAPRALAALGLAAPQDFAGLVWGGLPAGAELPEPRPLFPRIDGAAYLAGAAPSPPPAPLPPAPPPPVGPSEEPPVIPFDEFARIELRVATVLAAESVPKSKKLLRLTVAVGEPEPRQLVAGIAQHYAPEMLVGRQVVVVANLQPARLMGIDSRGMVLAASVDGRPVLLAPDAAVPDGAVVR